MTALDRIGSASTRRTLARLNAAVDATGDVRALAWLRMAAGPIVIAHLSPFLADAGRDIAIGDRFTQPFAAWYPVAAPGLYRAMLFAAVGTAVLMSVGALTRIATAYTTGFVTYNLFLSVTHFHHNRAFLAVLLIGLAALPVGRHLSVDALVGRLRGSPAAGPARLWPLWVLRFEVATVYAASGVSKLLDPDWWGGTVTTIRVGWGRSLATEAGVPAGLLDVLADPGFQAWFAKLIVLTELFIGFGLLWRRTRLAALWVAVPFHVSIQLVARVQVFSYAALAALVIWVTPVVRDRTVIVRGRTQARRARVLRSLDWFSRFTVVDEPGDGPSLTLVDRPGRQGEPVVRHGTAARRFILTRLPPTFWFAAPLLLPGVGTKPDGREGDESGRVGGRLRSRRARRQR